MHGRIDSYPEATHMGLGAQTFIYVCVMCMKGVWACIIQESGYHHEVMLVCMSPARARSKADSASPCSSSPARMDVRFRSFVVM
jgi:hypothetical protein